MLPPRNETPWVYGYYEVTSIKHGHTHEVQDDFLHLYLYRGWVVGKKPVTYKVVYPQWGHVLEAVNCNCGSTCAGWKTCPAYATACKKAEALCELSRIQDDCYYYNCLPRELEKRRMENLQEAS